MRRTVSWDCPVGCASCDALHRQRDRGFAVPCDSKSTAWLSSPAAAHASAMELLPRPPLCVRVRFAGDVAAAMSSPPRAGENHCACRCPTSVRLSQAIVRRTQAVAQHARRAAQAQNPLNASAKSSEAKQLPATPGNAEGTPVPDSKAELPPVIRRAEIVAFALVSLLIICVVAVLYVAKAFFLPVMMAFIVGTMLSPAASFLERYRIPRARRRGPDRDRGRRRRRLHGRPDRLAGDGMEQRLPELAAQLKEKLHVFDRPLALWQQLQGMLGGSDTLATFQHAEIRMGAADARIPVADLRRIPAVRRHADPVHRELEGPAPRPGHEFRRPTGRGCERCGSSTRSRSISAAIWSW